MAYIFRAFIQLLKLHLNSAPLFPSNIYHDGKNPFFFGLKAPGLCAGDEKTTIKELRKKNAIATKARNPILLFDQDIKMIGSNVWFSASTRPTEKTERDGDGKLKLKKRTVYNFREAKIIMQASVSLSCQRYDCSVQKNLFSKTYRERARKRFRRVYI